jgi:hypothetical protein
VSWLNHIVFWHWWVLAAALLVLELTSPVFFFLWLAFAAAAVGFLLLVFPGLPATTQLALFAALSLVAVLAWRRYRTAHPAQSGPPTAGAPGSPCVGRLLTLDQPIVAGAGEFRVDGSTLRLRGPDLPAGARVRVIRVDGATLVVEATEEL